MGAACKGNEPGLSACEQISRKYWAGFQVSGGQNPLECCICAA